MKCPKKWLANKPSMLFVCQQQPSAEDYTAEKHITCIETVGKITHDKIKDAWHRVLYETEPKSKLKHRPVSHLLEKDLIAQYML